MFPDFKELLSAFNVHSVRYLVAGRGQELADLEAPDQAQKAIEAKKPQP